MKLSKMLISSGTLMSGRVRHCSEWEISSLAGGSRFGGSRMLRLAAMRRAQPHRRASAPGVLSLLGALGRWMTRR